MTDIAKQPFIQNQVKSLRQNRIVASLNSTISFSSNLELQIIIFRPYSNAEVVGPTSPASPTVTFAIGPEDIWYVYAANIPQSEMLQLISDLNTNNVERLMLNKGALGAVELALLNNVTTLDELQLLGWNSLEGMHALSQISSLVIANSSPIGDDELSHLTGLSQLQNINLNSATTISNTGMLYLAAMTGLHEVTLNRTGVDQNGIGVLLGGAGNIQNLFMERLSITDALVPLIAARPMLALDFDETNISDNGVSNLSSISTLTNLDLKDIKGTPAIQDATLNLILGSLNQLRAFAATSGTITDAGLTNLSGLPLVELDLNSTNITDGIIPDIGSIATLNSLILSDTSLTDAETDQFTNLVELKELFLANTAIGDNTLAHLHGISGLLYLDVSGTQVSPTGVAALQTALPNLVIDS